LVSLCPIPLLMQRQRLEGIGFPPPLTHSHRERFQLIEPELAGGCVSERLCRVGPLAHPGALRVVVGESTNRGAAFGRAHARDLFDGLSFSLSTAR
jgi:hypothetical protein